MKKGEIKPKQSGLMFTITIAINLVVSFAVTFILGFVAMSRLGAADSDAALALVEEYLKLPEVVWSVQIGLHALMIAAAVLFFAAMKGSVFKDSGLAKKISFKDLLMSFALGVSMLTGLLIINNMYSILLESMGYDFTALGGLPKLTTSGSIIAGLFGLVILPSFSEELLFRGIILRGLRKMGMWKAALLSSTLFMLMHMNFAQALNAFMAGFVLSLVYFKTGSLWPSVIVHFVNNLLSLALQTVMDNYAGGEEAFLAIPAVQTGVLIASLVGMAALALCLWYFLRKPNAEGWSKEGEPDQPPLPQNLGQYGMHNPAPFAVPPQYDPFYPPEQQTPPNTPYGQPQQGGYPPQGGYTPPQQGGYPPQGGGYTPPQQGGYPPQGGYQPPRYGAPPPYQPQRYGGYPPRPYVRPWRPESQGILLALPGIIICVISMLMDFMM